MQRDENCWQPTSRWDFVFRRVSFREGKESQLKEKNNEITAMEKRIIHVKDKQTPTMRTGTRWHFTILLYVLNDTDDMMRVQNAKGCTFVHTQKKLWKRRNKQKTEMGKSRRKGVKSKRNRERNRKKGRIIEERIDRRVDIIINEQTTGSPLNLFEIPYHRMGNPPKNPGSSLFRNTFSGILSITPEETANIIRTAASLPVGRSFLELQILWCLFGVWVACETLFSSLHLKIVICTFDPRYQLPILRSLPSYCHWSRGYLKASFVALWDLSFHKLIMNNPVWREMISRFQMMTLKIIALSLY